MDFVPWTETYRATPDDDVLVNPTSIGLFPNVQGRLDIDLSGAVWHAIVADLIPNPLLTLFLRDVERLGLSTHDGLGMLVNQGVVSIRH